MALAGRSSRRGGGRRWILVGLVLTLVVVLIDASVKSRSQTPVRQLSGQAWVDHVLPVVTSSDAVARELQSLRADPTSLSAAQLRVELTSMTKTTRHNYESVMHLGVPTSLTGPATLLQTCLNLRSQATATFAGTISGQLAAPAGSSTTQAAQTLTSAVRQLEVADSACKLFASRWPKADGPVQADAWVTDASQYSAAKLQVWLASLRSKISLTPVHAISIVALSTTPSPLRVGGGTETLPASPLDVAVVLGNTGNQVESNLTVKATLSAATTPSGATASGAVPALDPGSDTTVQLGPLQP
ncbi:MAG TPA: hypothetical protein VKV06_01050, partial [Acidimicrobiales bacterium]|nr:hypothetical protein [Acidimicrobiales bacterium]